MSLCSQPGHCWPWEGVALLLSFYEGASLELKYASETKIRFRFPVMLEKALELGESSPDLGRENGVPGVLGLERLYSLSTPGPALRKDTAPKACSELCLS